MLAYGTKLKKNEINHLADGSTEIIAYYKGEQMKILVDTADWPIVEPYFWYVEKVHQGYYAKTKTRCNLQNEEKPGIRMHRLLLSTSHQIDHRNQNGLDNRRENLRAATFSQNNMNRGKTAGATSKYLGVSWDSSRNKWFAKIKKNKVQYPLGRYEYSDEAALIRDFAALKLFEDFANLNFKINKNFAGAYIATAEWWKNPDHKP